MGITSEKVAERYGVTRQEQDQAAVSVSIIIIIIYIRLWRRICNPLICTKQVFSHKRAAAASASGKFRDEIIPVFTKVRCNQSICKHCFPK